MPSLGADMDTGKLVEWLVAPGDSVTQGTVMAVVETQKGAIEIEIFEAGEVVDLVAQVGQTLPVGALLARIGTAGEAGGGGDREPNAVASRRPPEPARGRVPETDLPAPAKPAPAKPAPAKPAPAKPATAKPATAASAPAGEAVLSSPAARTLAAEAKISLASITGSGPSGAVLLSDVERHLAAGASPVSETPEAGRPTARKGLDMVEMRRAIAAAMTRANRDIPHYYLCHEIDLQAAQDRLATLNIERTPDRRLLMGALLIRATVRALAKVPELNGRHEGDAYVPSGLIHCGLAVAIRGGGLIAPAILDAADMDPDTLMEAMRDIVARTRAGRLRNSELTRGTITVSSLGETGVDALFGVIYPPQVALVGFGAPRLKPVVHDGAVTPRLAVTVSLAADHRVSDGRRGALFLAEISRLLQDPELP